MTSLTFAKSPKSLVKGSRTLLVLAPASAFRPRKLPSLLDSAKQKLLLGLARDASPGDQGTLVSTRLTGSPRRLFAGVLPDKVSRYNAPSRAEAIRRLVSSADFDDKGKVAIALVLDDPSHLLPAANAVARAFPKFSRKAGAPDYQVELLAVDSHGDVIAPSDVVLATIEATRDSAELVDTPPTELNPEAYAKRIRELLKGLPRVKIREIEGAKLLSEKLVGIHSVGRAAVNAPRMVIAQYSPARGDAAGKRRHFALVGKGVTFDTGGLNLKISGSMRSMKCDMGGSAAVLGAFRVLVQGGFEHDLTLIMCLAENAIDANSYKPDDILTVHSGKTVEINNTDAEGRLLLIDGVSYAARVLGADTIIDAATLTGAQMIATGQMHAVIVSNDGAAEAELVAAGTTSGDLCHPLPFAPEFYKSEFESVVADMCNSVHNRMNAQTACAAQFVYWHLEGTDVRWCHIDLAGPAFRKNRGTGYGVALISQGVRNLAALDATEQAAD